MTGDFVKTSITSDPTPINTIIKPPPPIKKVVQWLTVRHPGGTVASYPMYPADEGLGWLQIDESLRPEDVVITVTPCLEQFFVVQTGIQLDMGTTAEEVQAWAQETLRSQQRGGERKKGDS
jgi:hypothetical protein